MADLKLFMVILGAVPPGRHTEQHDVFFGIGPDLASLKNDMQEFWSGVKIHIDSWREISIVNGYKLNITERTKESQETFSPEEVKLFFINLGGYKPEDMEEYHYKVISATKDKSAAIAEAKATIFFKHTGFKGARSHVDDKFGIDVDDFHNIADILPETHKRNYKIELQKLETPAAEDTLHIGYLILDKL
jgi:hypothetical protein